MSTLTRGLDTRPSSLGAHSTSGDVCGPGGRVAGTATKEQVRAYRDPDQRRSYS